MPIPRPADALPEFTQLTIDLAAQRQDGTITDWESFKTIVLAFFTPDMMDKVDHVVSSWHEMAVCADHQTLHHVTSVLVALHALPEYQQAAPEEQDLLTWMVLFHDVAKIARPGEHDYIHAFRSAAIAGKALAKAGFAASAVYPDRIADWFTLTYNAVIWREDLQDHIQDNRHLPAIISGLHQLYDPPAAAVIKAVLLHLSVITDPVYPIHAPLTDSEYIEYVDATTHRLLKAMMIVDTDAWNLFDPREAQRYRAQSLTVFDRMGAQIRQ